MEIDMQTLNAQAAAVLNTLTAGLEPGQVRRVGATDGPFMQVVVERLNEEHFSVSHYYTANGDLVPDPDMEFLRTPAGAWACVSITQPQGYEEAIHYSDAWELVVDAVALSRLTAFAQLWMRNIQSQQDLSALPAPS
jgi:hypothetical protein